MSYVYYIYHSNEATKKITNLLKIRFEHGFISSTFLRSILYDFSEEYFLDKEDEDPENEIYMINEWGDKLGHFKKKYFSTEADEEPFDSDKEKDVDWNGGMEW